MILIGLWILVKNLKKVNLIGVLTVKFICPTKAGGEKLLDISSSRDKIVQKAIYLAFLEIYENKLKYFSDRSHGFRSNRNCHSALCQIKFG